MVRTYEQKEEEGETPFDFEVQTRDISFDFGLQGEDRETVEEFAETLERILTPTPPNLAGRVIEGTGGGDGRGGGNIPGFNVDLSQLNNEELLRVIASAIIAQTRSIFNIEDYLRPITQITVSGTNTISNSGTSEPVVPNSDNIDIPTRKLYVRASKTNNDPIYLGDDGVGSGEGYPLYKGEGEFFEINLADEVLYMASATSGQQIELMGVI